MSEIQYLVRGALLKCDCGSHPRRLNLPMCHGFYTNNHPVIQEEDCEVGIHINHFGICVSETPPPGAKEVVLESYTRPGESKGPDIQGLKCCPIIIGMWRDTKKDTKLAGETSAEIGRAHV